MEVFNYDFIVISIVTEILLTLFNQVNKLTILFVFFIKNKMLKNLEKECSIEAITVSAHASNLLELRVDIVKAVLKFIITVFKLKNWEV